MTRNFFYYIAFSRILHSTKQTCKPLTFLLYTFFFVSVRLTDFSFSACLLLIIILLLFALIQNHRVGITITGTLFLFIFLLRHHLLSRTLCFLERENMMLLKKVRYLRTLNILSSLFGCLGAILSCLAGVRYVIKEENQDVSINTKTQ